MSASDPIDIPGYTYVRDLGSGGMGKVLLAIQDSLGRQVAIKLMNRATASDSEFIERFAREARVIASFSHPNIVTVHDFGPVGDTWFLSMEYLPRGTLKDRIRSGLTPGQAVDIIITIAEALAYAHRHGVVHRDLKPLNVMFRQDGLAVLTDFGIARILSQEGQLTKTGLFIGSPRYMSPEQLLKQQVDNRADLFSLGIVFCECLTGVLPWSEIENPLVAAMKNCYDPTPQLPVELSAYQCMLDKLLAKQPEDRYQNAEAFLKDIRQHQSSTEHLAQDPQATVISMARPGFLTRSEVDVSSQRPRLMRIIIPVAMLIATVAILVLVSLSPYSEKDDASMLGDIRDSASVAHELEGSNRPADDKTSIAYETNVKEDAETSKTADQDKTDEVVQERIAQQQRIDEVLSQSANLLDSGDQVDALELIDQALLFDPDNVELKDAKIRTQELVEKSQAKQSAAFPSQEDTVRSRLQHSEVSSTETPVSPPTGKTNDQGEPKLKTQAGESIKIKKLFIGSPASPGADEEPSNGGPDSGMTSITQQDEQDGVIDRNASPERPVILFDISDAPLGNKDSNDGRGHGYYRPGDVSGEGASW